MKRITFLLIFLIFHFYAFSQTLFQVSYYDALNKGKLDGITEVNEILKHGNTGIGGFHALDGEMIILNGKCYKIPADGKIKEADKNASVTFAAIFNFKQDKSITLLKTTEAYRIIDSLINNNDAIAAIKIYGKFEYVKTRSVPAQNKPYPALSEIIKTQKIFDGKNITGTITGVRTPAIFSVLNPAGYHLHFLSDDKTLGGHLLDMRPENINCEIMIIKEINLKLPD